jgi:hypothetical protein
VIQKEIPQYESIDEAFAKLSELDPCVDNYRVAEISDSAQLQAYVHKQSRGCCGQHDSIALIGESYEYTTDKPSVVKGTYYRLCLIGCNYGH